MHKRSGGMVILVAALLAACAGSGERVQVDAAGARQAAAVVEIGTLDGAQYRIDIPADWNGELVMNANGYVPAGSPPTAPEVPGGMQPLLDRGFAVAASD